MSAWNIVRPVTRSKFIDALGSDNLPYVQLAAGVLIGVLMHFYTGAIRRLPGRLVIPVTQTGIIALLVGCSWLLRTGAVWVTVAFYFAGLILGILLISQFWTLANDLYDARQANALRVHRGGSSLAAPWGRDQASVAGKSDRKLLLVAAGILVVGVVSSGPSARHPVGATPTSSSKSARRRWRGDRPAALVASPPITPSWSARRRRSLE